jgi:lipopolysaccharide biosynthesis protein
LVTAYFRRKIEKCNIETVVDYSKKGIIRPIALYLPQFHQIPENDEWWGKGFTEWTNVKKAKPLFRGHYQPHVPHKDIGYYDLSNVEVMRKQAEIAKKYGIYGFCFYYYYFKDGKRLLEKPLDNWLAHTEIDFPFCFCWANENWTRAWDGGDKEVLMPQDYDLANMERMVHEMIPAFKDNRYIKVDGKPILLVYRPEIIPEIKVAVESWRRIVRENGIPDVYVVMVQNFSSESPLVFGMDAACEFACTKADVVQYCDEDDIDVDTMNISETFVRSCAVRKHYRLIPQSKEYVRYKCVCPSWDNTARWGARASLIVDANPEEFGKFLDEAFSLTMSDDRLREKGFVFINAWNEWGEGAHLEPDEKYGYANLEQVAASIKRFSD